MASYTVESIIGQEEWSGNQGQMRTYELMLQGESRPVSLTRKAGSQPPSAGETLDGFINESAKGRNFKVDRQNGSQSSTGGGGKDFDRRPDHPIQMARALHTSALSTAPVLIDQMLTLGVIEQPADKDAYLKLVEGVATWVQATYPKPVLDVAAKADAA